MKSQISFLSLSIFLLVAGCVTINVYFPAAAAEKAADRIIEQVWGEDKGDKSEKPKETETPETVSPPAETPPQPKEENGQSTLPGWAMRLLENVIAPAIAEANLNISTPEIKAIESRMSARHKTLESHYDSGAIGLTNDALITLRDPNAVPLAARNKIKQAVTQENEDRLELYHEIAVANNHPEWEKDIRATFAKRWIEKAKSGWWYQDSKGNWLRK